MAMSVMRNWDELYTSSTLVDPMNYISPDDYHRSAREMQMKIHDASEQIYRGNYHVYKFLHDGFEYTVDRYGNLTKEPSRDYWYRSQMAVYGHKVFSDPRIGYIAGIDVGYEEKKAKSPEPKKEDRSKKYRNLYWHRYLKKEERPI